MSDLSSLPAEELAARVRSALGGTNQEERGRAAVNELVRRASERDQAVQQAEDFAVLLSKRKDRAEVAEAEARRLRDGYERVRLESEDELATELAEERILHQQALDRIEQNTRTMTTLYESSQDHLAAALAKLREAEQNTLTSEEARYLLVVNGQLPAGMWGEDEEVPVDIWAKLERIAG